MRSKALFEIAAIEESTIHGYVDHMRGLCSDDGQRKLSDTSIARALVAVRSFHRFAVLEGGIDVDPAQDVGAPRVAQGIPKALSEAEVEKILSSDDRQDVFGLRDRAMLELLYASGLRISELVGLDLDAIDLDDGQVRVLGKGSKERFVPVGRTARVTIERYLAIGRLILRDSRPRGKAETDAIFLNARGGRLTRQACWQIVRDAGERAGIQDRLTPHVLRHCFATHMLDHGADIRVVQELLGHASVSTTQIYTKVSPDRLRSAYEAAHPRARRE